MARALDHQARLGLTSLSRFTFTPEQEQFILDFLYNNHRDVYNNLMQDTSGTNTTRPPFW
jgi:hypothetical protein